MSIIHPALARCLLSVSAAALSAACVTTELPTPNDHPASVAARAGRLPTVSDLHAELGNAAEANASHGSSHEPGVHDHTTHGHATHDGGHEHDAPDDAGHQHGARDEGTKPSAGAESEKDGAAARYTCPMHPEIVKTEPGACPRCGMKLVPVKGAK